MLSVFARSDSQKKGRGREKEIKSPGIDFVIFLAFPRLSHKMSQAGEKEEEI